MGDVLVSALVKNVLGRLTDVSIQEFKLVWGLNKDLLALRDTLIDIHAVLEDAEVKQRKEKTVEIWLRRLRSASLEVENVLDEVSTETMLRRLRIQRGIKYRVRASFSSDHNRLMVRTRIAHKVKNIRTRLAKIDANKSKFELTVGSASVDVVVGVETSNRETSSLVGCLSEICGRDAEIETAIQKICNKDIVTHDADDVRVYVMWGMGGVGKTTLAQLVYSHESVKTHFELKCWMYVSMEFDVKKLTRGIIESIDGCEYKLTQLDKMQVDLQDRLRGKRFLIVLDDVWNIDMTKWEELRKALCCGADGSVVMVTTRYQEISEMMVKYPEFRHAVGRLSEEDSWSLFKKHAFRSGRERGNTRELEPIGKKIVEKCKGLPLAVKTLGGLMRSKNTVDEWLLVKNSEIWELQENDVDVFPALKLSYDNLTSHLKRCFAYCCLFPKGFKMEKNLLIEVWIANGFIPFVREEDLYVVGEEIFSCLVRTSFFHDVQEVENSMDQTCKMHDLMHDLARYVMRHDCSFIEPDKEMTTPNEVVHLSSSCPDFLFTDEGWEELRSLRSIFIFNDEYKGSVSQIFKHRYLRVLWLPRIVGKTLPASICKLKHLRYLNMSWSKIEFLPELIIYLQNLQVLILTCCFSLRKLPEAMRYLRSLRHLDISGCPLECIPVAKLVGLRRLPEFTVGIKNEARIGELGDLNLLGWKVQLNGLENVRGKGDAKSARLKYKTNLISLVLKWTSDSSRWGEGDEEVLEGLEPNSSLKELEIDAFAGKKISSWIVNLQNLVKICFRGCKECECIPALAKLPNLRVVEISAMRSLMCFHDDDNTTSQDDNLFPSLQQLKINSSILVSLPSNLPNLQTLDISSCPGLVSLPSNLPNLQTLDIISCVWLVSLPSNLPNLQRLDISSCPGLVSLPSNLPNLQTLDIISCVRLVSLPSNLPNLQRLDISSCPGLVSLPSNLPNLQTLDIISCDGLVSLPSNLPNLQRLDISSCPGLVSLPSNLPNLQTLDISSCPGLVSLPNNLPNVQRLYIYNCYGLVSLPSNLPNLQTLDISSFPGLVSLPSNLPNLQTLDIISCDGLVSLPSNLPNLQRLVISSCPGLVSLPNELLILKELTSLKIMACDKLCIRYQKEIGEDWPKISHIPHIHIDDPRQVSWSSDEDDQCHLRVSPLRFPP